ncbi:MAG: energy-coupling factor transporter transmembrane component T [Solirubrobacteraceae bacterium]
MTPGLTLAYRRRASPLHSARAAAGATYCVGLVLCALILVHPLELLVLLAVVLAAGRLAGVAGDVRRAAVPMLILVVAIAAINALISRNGLTVVARLGYLPPFGEIDITAESLVYGAALGLQMLLAVFVAMLATAAVNPDELLRGFRRLSLRSALTAALATRLVPLLEADGRRLADAQRCRAEEPRHRRVAIVRAVATGALDRALDVAATLEVRGYALGRRPPRRPTPLSRHDVAFTAAGLALVAAAVAAKLGGLAAFDADPRLAIALGPGEVALAAALILIALLPFADRRGIDP